MKYVAPRPMPTRKKPRDGSSKLPMRSNQFKAASTSRKSTSRFSSVTRGSPAEYVAGLKLAIERGGLKMHEPGTFATFTPGGAELFA